MDSLITFDAPPDLDPLAAFHPTIAAWFRERLGAPSPPQARGWPRIRAGESVLIAAPTGSGKTLAAFLAGLDALLREGDDLPRQTRILYISPLRALSNDVQKNLQRPLAELRERDPSLPEVRVLVRTGDTPASERQAMSKKHPHILVTTPESLSILLTSEGGRAMLGGVQTVIIDEIHALARDKRGVHLALSLERLEALVTRTGAEPSVRSEVPAASLQRIGLSATQRPIEDVASFLVGVGRPCVVVDGGHRRDLDLEIVVPGSPIEAVCSHETWGEIYHQISTLIQQHTTTLVFVNTRTLAERIAARLTELLGADEVASHHGSLSRELRLDAEQRLKAGKLRALVATASLELGIDIGDVDLVIQVGSSRSIATLLQRVGRSGHALGKTPKGRVFPLTRDELVEAAGVLRAVRLGELDRIVMSRKPLDILAQQIVSECVARAWNVQALYEQLTRAWPYRDLDRADFDAAWALHTHTGKSAPEPEPVLVGAAAGQAQAPAYENPEGGPDIARPTTARGRLALLHHDGTTGVLRATKRARLVVVSSGGAIPDTADYQVQVEPDGVVVGTLFEDFAIESSAGDIFQLGNTSWQILRVEPGVVRVADAKGAPPTIPFWVGEAPARTAELSAVVSTLREEVVTRANEAGAPAAVGWLEEAAGVRPDAGEQIVEYLVAGAKALGTIPTQARLVLERFFDEAGGTQLVLHAPFGGRINRALGLALRKRFCVGFGFELQAAANEEAIIFSLGQQHSFPIEEVYDYLKSPTAEKVLVQALLQAPMFETRWRWNATRSLLVERARAGKKIPPPIVRMRTADLLAAAFPQAAACPETLPPGPLEVPDHPIVRQTVEDCLTEAMDRGGFLQVVEGLQKGRIARVAVDSPEPSILAHGILTAQPYTFLDDAPLEERRTHAVMARRGLDVRQQDGIGALDTAAIDRVRDEAWPQPTSADEVHEALSWIGYLTEREAQPWAAWIAELEAARRIRRVDGPIVAVPGAPEDGTVGPRWILRAGAGDVPGSGDTLDALRGRLEGLGPVVCADPRMLELEREGTVLRVRFEGKDGWCHRRLLARIQRYTVERLRREIAPVTAADFLRFLARWQRVEQEQRLEGPKGLATVLRQLSGFEVPAVEWERSVLPARVKGYRRDWLDQLTLSGEFAWGRLWGEAEPSASGAGGRRCVPLCFVSRDELPVWTDLAGPSALVSAAPVEPAPKVPVDGFRKLGPAEAAPPAPPQPAESDQVRRLVALLEAKGAQFQDDLARSLGFDAQTLEVALGEAVARGLATCDGFGAARGLIVPAGRRVAPVRSFGRWSRFRAAPEAPAERPADTAASQVVAAAQAAAAVDVVDGVCKALLRRWGVVFKRLLTREQLPIPWRELARRFRILEMRGELRGGRFVNGFSGEQWALPEAVEQLRELRRNPPAEVVTVAAADPLNLRGILTPDERVPRTSRKRVIVGPDPEQTPSVKPPAEPEAPSTE